jgi:hypothetical protein
MIYDILRTHVNYNFQNDHNIPIPSDYLMEHGLSMYDYKDWIPNKLGKDEKLIEFNLINDKKLKAFNERKRKYIFIIACNTQNIDDIKLEKMFRPSYANSVIYNKKTKKPNKLSKVKDYACLRNAVLLIHALKKERVFREVYLVRDG